MTFLHTDPELGLAQLPVHKPDADRLRRTIQRGATLREPERLLGGLDTLDAPATDTAQLRALAHRRRPARLRWALAGCAAVACTAVVLVMVNQPTPTWTLDGIMGDVVITRGGRSITLDAGEALQPGDVVETGRSTRVQMHLGEDSALTVDLFTHVEIGQTQNGTPVLNLRRGRAEGTIRSKRGRLRFHVKGHDVELESGSIGLVRAGNGRLAVASLRGTSRVVVDGQPLAIRPEHHLHLRGGELTKSKRVAPELQDWQQLRVADGGARSIPVRGRVDPHVLLVINDTLIETNDDGQFSTELLLATVRKKIRVEMVDASGQVVKRERSVERLSTDLRWGEPG